ncbi:TCP1L protein, partial [Neopipo cinnamomea]|nr:TCP1L protein [Neopipo cinnamomea]
MRMHTHEKKADSSLAEWEIKTDCKAKVVQQSAEEKEVIGRDEESKENPVDSSQRRWPEILQPCPETMTDMNLQIGEERETRHVDSLGQAGRTDERPLETTLTKDLGRVDQIVKGHLTAGAKTPLEFLLRHPFQDLETDRMKEAECSAGPAFTQGQKWVQGCPQELVLGTQNSESERQIHTGFKMVNDKIIKITCNPPEAAEKGGSSSALQQEWQRKGTVAPTWQVVSLSCESNCLSCNSDDDPKSYHVQHPSQHVPQRVDQTDRHLDLSDGDYANIQAILGQQDLSCSTSSSDSSTGAVRSKGSKARSSLQQSLFHLTRLKRRKHEPESKNENRDSSVKSLHLPSSKVAHEIPIFKIKEIPEVDELQKKLFTDTLVLCTNTNVFTEETQNILSRGLETGNSGGTPSLTAVKEKCEKAIHFHSTLFSDLFRQKQYKQESKNSWDIVCCVYLVSNEAGTALKTSVCGILKQQIARLQEEFKRSESCWHAAYSKLRDQVELLTRQNMELRDELRISEHQRWKAEKTPKAVNFLYRKSETPVAEAILQETASSSKQEESSWRDNCKSLSTSHVGLKTCLQRHLIRHVSNKVV